MRGRNTTPCLIRHINQNRRFMSSLDNIPEKDNKEINPQIIRKY